MIGISLTIQARHIDFNSPALWCIALSRTEYVLVWIIYMNLKINNMKVKEIKLLKELLKKYISDFNSETDCYEKWMESVQDEVRWLLSEEE